MSAHAERLGFRLHLPRPPELILLVIVFLISECVDTATGVLLVTTHDPLWIAGGIFIAAWSVAMVALFLLALLQCLALYRRTGDLPRPRRGLWGSARKQWTLSLVMITVALLIHAGPLA